MQLQGIPTHDDGLAVIVPPEYLGPMQLMLREQIDGDVELLSSIRAGHGLDKSLLPEEGEVWRRLDFYRALEGQVDGQMAAA